MVILITGSSTGIGYAIAEKLARNGHIVYATMRNLHKSSSIQKLLKEENLNLHVLQLDVLDDALVDKAVATVLSKESHIDVLVNNAGIHSWAQLKNYLWNCFAPTWRLTISVYCDVLKLCCHLCEKINPEASLT